MMYEVKGINTQKVYATGSRADCFRKLKEDYPFKTSERANNRVLHSPLYPEPLKITRKRWLS